MASNDDRRAQCATDQVKAFELLAQIPRLLEEMKSIPELRDKVETLSYRIDNLDKISESVINLKTDFDDFKTHVEEKIITPFESISDLFLKIKSRAPWVIIFLLVTGADWDNFPKILSVITNGMKLVGL